MRCPIVPLIPLSERERKLQLHYLQGAHVIYIKVYCRVFQANPLYDAHYPRVPFYLIPTDQLTKDVKVKRKVNFIHIFNTRTS